MLTVWATLAEDWLGGPVMSYMGKISYSLYLWHMPVFWYFNRFSPLPETPLLFMIIAFPVVILVSAISYRFIELPARKAINETVIPFIVRCAASGKRQAASRVS